MQTIRSHLSLHSDALLCVRRHTKGSTTLVTEGLAGYQHSVRVEATDVPVDPTEEANSGSCSRGCQDWNNFIPWELSLQRSHECSGLQA